jgi:hypothetical protein
MARSLGIEPRPDLRNSRIVTAQTTSRKGKNLPQVVRCQNLYVTVINRWRWSLVCVSRLDGSGMSPSRFSICLSFGNWTRSPAAADRSTRATDFLLRDPLFSLIYLRITDFDEICIDTVATYYTTENLVEVPEALSHIEDFLLRDAFCHSGRLDPLVVRSPGLLARLQLLVEADKDLSESEVKDDSDGEAGEHDAVTDPVGFTEFLIPDVTEKRSERNLSAIPTSTFPKKAYLPAMLPSWETAFKSAMAL